jgi:glycosyltransferase involved in cell wall biosynthesis
VGELSRRFGLVAYYFPPENAAGAARPFRFYRYLPEFGFDPRVFTAADPATGPAMAGVVRVRDELGEYWQRGAPKPGAMALLPELALRRYGVIAGVGFHWSRLVARECRKWQQEIPNERVTVFSTYPPLGGLLTPLWLDRRRFRIVVDYRDPFSAAGPADWQKDFRVRRWIDERVIRRADVVIANSDSAAEAFRSAFPGHARKIWAIWNGFDPADELAARPIPERPGPVIAHVGSIYTGRSPDAILASVRRLREAGPERWGRVRVSLIGPLGFGARIDPALIEAGTSDGWLEYVPNLIPKAEANRITAESDYLLLLQPQSSVQVPAKLFEYLRIGRPILAYAPKNSAIEWLLERAGVPYECVYPEDAAEAVDGKLRRLLETPTGPYAASEWFRENFDARNQTRRLTELIRQIS